MNKHNHRLFLPGIVALITFVVYLVSLQNGFVDWDDFDYVTDNIHIRAFNFNLFRWAFFEFYASNWHPLTWISHAIDYALWGLNPLQHHLSNNIIHSLNTFVVVIVVIALLKSWQESRVGQGTWLDDRSIVITATTAGLLFGLHPVHVESVAWVSERKDLLCALFFLLSIKTYIAYARTSSLGLEQSSLISRLWKKNYLLSLGLFLLALLSKPMAVTLPVILLILDWYPFYRVWSFKTLQNAIVEKLPFFTLSLGTSLLTIMAQDKTHALLETSTLSTRLLVGTKALIAYITKMLVPVKLLPYYAYPQDVSLLSLKYLIPVLLVVGMTVGFIMLVKRQRLWLSAWLYYLVMLLPVIGIVQVGKQAMADRYTYLPSLGPFLLMGLGLAWTINKTSSLRTESPEVRKIIIAGALPFLLLMSFTTIRQITVWKDSVTLWSYVIDNATIKDAIPYKNRGTSFQKLLQLNRALEDYNTAIKINPNYDEAYNNRGTVYEILGQHEKAIADFTVVLAINPSDYITLTNRGLIYIKMGQLDKAIVDLNASIAINGTYYISYHGRGVINYNTGAYDRAIQDYTKAISLNPYDHISYHYRGFTFRHLGQLDRAIQDLSRAVELYQGDPQYYYDLGITYYMTNQLKLAAANLKHACRAGYLEACKPL